MNQSEEINILIDGVCNLKDALEKALYLIGKSSGRFYTVEEWLKACESIRNNYAGKDVYE